MQRWFALLSAAVLALSCGDVTGNSPGDDSDVSWLEEHALIINTADPAVAEPSLAALQEIIGDARIVGMGEATHGTREFWQIRQKLSKYLVENMGFTAILHEAPLPNSLYLDAYVTEGEGTALQAHEKLGYWRFQEMQELIAWMRAHNVGRPQQEPALHYVGYDCAVRNWTEAINLIADYLSVVDPAAVADITARLENYTLEDARYVYDYIESRREAYIALSTAAEYELILKIAQNLGPAWQVWYNLENRLPEMDVREACNIDNVNWIIENMLDGGKVVLWAHNAHVGNVYLDEEVGGGQAQMLGSRLKEQYGGDYYTVGTEFYGGRFMAWDVCGGYYSEFVVHQAALPGRDTYAYRLHEGGIPLFLLDLSRLDYSNEDASWLMGPLDVRLIGADYCPQNDAEYYYATSLPVHYDGIVYFETTSPVTRITF